MTAALAMMLGAAGLVALNGSPAVAAPMSSEFATTIQAGYTDSVNPTTAYDWPQGVHVPLGSKADGTGVIHTTRVYATFDLTPFAGKHILSSGLRFKEAAAADCSKRAIEIWRTRAVDATPTWKFAPAEIAKVDETLTPEFCPTSLTSDMTSTVAQLLAEGKRKVTFEIRVPAAHEADTSYFRTLDWNYMSLSVRYDTPPKVDDRHMYNSGFACRTAAPYPTLGGSASLLEGVITDPDSSTEQTLTTEFAVWPENDPSARRTYTHPYGTSGRVATARVENADLADGQGYAWQYRVSDGFDTSSWSKTCHFVVDRTKPSAPIVTSPNYPAEDIGLTPLGQPGRFVFDGQGDTDVAGFAYAWETIGVSGCSLSGEFGQLECPKPFDRPGTVRADTPGGTATVKLSPPRAGLNTLVVRALDTAGNSSAEDVTYRIVAPFSDPSVTIVGAEPAWNKPVTLKFSPYPGVKNVTGYTYRIDYGEVRTVTAGADGTATVTFVASNLDGPQVTVRSTSANGFVSAEGNWMYTFYPWPGVQSDVYPADWAAHGGVGVPGTFTFSPPPGTRTVVSYRYAFNFGEYLDVPADADGIATVTWAPEASGFNVIEVYAVMADGSLSDLSNILQFIVK